MSLRLITGRAGSGKTRFCLEEITAKIKGGAGHPLIFLVPEQYTFQAERDLISALGRGGILKTVVLSFRRMAFRVFNEAGGITYPHIHPAGKSMILYRILDKEQKKFHVFAKSAGRPGFVNTLAALITEFKRYQLTPAVLEKAAEGFDGENPLKGKLTELVDVYQAFEETIAERYRDADDDLTLAAEKLESVNLYEGAEIWIDGFAGFTPQEYRVMERLMQKARRVTISLCLDNQGKNPGTDVFASVRGAQRKFVRMAEEMGIAIEPPVDFGGEPPFRFAKSSELAHLERYLNAYPYRTYPGKTENISLFAAVNIFSEIEAAARDIIRLVRDRGMRYRDMALVVRNLQGYGRLIEVIFAEYGIPCFIDQKREITNHPLVRLILSMLEIFVENWSYEAVFRYLKTGLTGFAQSDVDRLENYCLASGIRGSRWTGDQEWRMSPDFIPPERESSENQALQEELAQINGIRFAVTGPLLEFRQKTKGKRQAAEFCGPLFDFLTAIGVPERMEEAMDGFQKSGQQSLANEYAQVWNMVMDVFDQTVQVMGDETFGLERFSQILEIGFAEYKIGLIPASLDQVLVGSAERSKSHGIKALYILGVNDGVFPAAAGSEGILSDLDRAALNGAGIGLASDTRTQAFDEQFLIYRTLTAVGGYLRLSWPIADQEGKTMRPSMIISRMRKLFPEIRETSNILKTDAIEEEMELVTAGIPSFKEMIAALREKAEGREISPLWPEVYRWFAGREDWQLKIQALLFAFQYQNLAPVVSRENIARLYGDPVNSSVSRLEKYTACPFAYFVQFGLAAKERKVYRLSPPDVGTFMHSVIEIFSRQLGEENISWREFDQYWCSERVSAIIDEMLARMDGSGLAGSKRYTALTIRLKRVITRALWLIAEHIRRGSFDPIGYEMDFSQGGQFPPIEMTLTSGETIRLNGRIDRLDAWKTAAGTYLRIVDYKSGTKDFHLSDVYYGLQLQLITYLDAIREDRILDITPPLLPGGVLYFRVDDPMIKTSGEMGESDMEKAIMKALRMKGLLLADVQLIRSMDRDLTGNSLIIPARINKGDVLGKSSAATPEQFQVLRRYVRKLLKGLCEEIMAGNVSIRPYKKKDTTSCKFCGFSAVCQFDTARSENTYHLLYDKEDGEVWDLLGKEGD